MPKLPSDAPRPTPDEQLRRWVDGDSVCPNSRDECCPDFSCCKPSLLQPEEVRRAFAAGSQADRERFCMAFLGGAIAELAPDKRVHVAGRDEPE